MIADTLDYLWLKPIYPERKNPGLVPLGDGWHAIPVRYVDAVGRVLVADRPPEDHPGASVASCDIFVAHGLVWCSPLFYFHQVADLSIEYDETGGRQACAEMTGKPDATHVHIVHPASITHPLPNFGDVLNLRGWICQLLPPPHEERGWGDWWQSGSKAFSRNSCPFFLPIDYLP